MPPWTRRFSHAAWIALWLAVNPFVFGAPAHQRAWSTRAMLGEELWISRRPRDGAMAVSALTLVYWEQMVRYLQRERRGRAGLLVA